MKTELVVIKATKAFKKRVKEAAERENKTLSSYVRDCILADFNKKEKNGIDKD
jgi:hypothetical protein